MGKGHYHVGRHSTERCQGLKINVSQLLHSQPVKLALRLGEVLRGRRSYIIRELLIVLIPNR